jgi:hypothetical protein
MHVILNEGKVIEKGDSNNLHCLHAQLGLSCTVEYNLFVLRLSCFLIIHAHLSFP